MVEINLAKGKLGKYIVLNIDGNKTDKQKLKVLGIIKGTILIKRGICPNVEPIKVQVIGIKNIRYLSMKLARKVNVNYTN